MPLLILLYLIGVLILTMRMLGELVYIQNLRFSRSQFVPEVWKDKIDELAKRMKIKTENRIERIYSCVLSLDYWIYETNNFYTSWIVG